MNQKANQEFSNLAEDLQGFRHILACILHLCGGEFVIPRRVFEAVRPRGEWRLQTEADETNRSLTVRLIDEKS